MRGDQTNVSSREGDHNLNLVSIALKSEGHYMKGDQTNISPCIIKTKFCVARMNQNCSVKKIFNSFFY